MTLLDLIKELCIIHSTTLSKLEKTLNFGNGTLSRWDTSSPSIDKVLKVAEYFNVSLDYFVEKGPLQKKEPKITATIRPTSIYNEVENIAEILGYKIHLRRDQNLSSIEFNGQEKFLATSKVLNLMSTIESFVKFTLQEATKNGIVETDSTTKTLIVAARGGTYELDKDAAQKLAQSASKAPNRSHDKDLI